MVLAYRSNHTYNFDFVTASIAFFNKYPNPFSDHVISADTISQSIDDEGRLHIERLIRKRGRMPTFMRPFLGNMSDSWILESSVVDPKDYTLHSWTRNVDHKRFLQVDDVTHYKADSLESPMVHVEHTMSFTSNFGRWGIKDKIESYSYSECKERINRSRSGMAYVMEQVRNKGLMAFKQYQLSPVASAE